MTSKREVAPPDGIDRLIERLSNEEERVRLARDREREAWQQREREFEEALRKSAQDLVAAVSVAAGVLDLPPGSEWDPARRVFVCPPGSPPDSTPTADAPADDSPAPSSADDP